MLYVPNPDLLKAMAQARGIGRPEDPVAQHIAALVRQERQDRQARRRRQLDHWRALAARAWLRARHMVRHVAQAGGHGA